MKAISLFSGAGGDTLGMHNAGVDVIAYVEYIKTFRETHDANFPSCRNIGESVNSDVQKITDDEIRQFEREHVDIIFAGFTCQSFSNAGKRKTNDPRDMLYKHFLRFASIIKPNMIIGENVKGLLTKIIPNTCNKYVDLIIDDFKSIGYNVDVQLLNCSKYGVPQKRERLFIIGKLSGIPRFPIPYEHTPDLTNIVKYNKNGIYRLSLDVFDYTQLDDKYITTDMSDSTDSNNVHPYLKLKADARNETYNGVVHKSLFSFGKRDSPIHCEIINIHAPSKTIICSYGHQPRLMVIQRNSIGYFLRCLSVDELKQIQMFPVDYVIKGTESQRITQIGNAVPSTVVTQIVRCNSTF